ncbi:hypothetical protein CWO07_22665 [Vibrio splendidus]|uniref:Acyltransferase 3 domain-containing protein n=1 Tax=Vibrio splendidus TaxID=29497 RepID=A0A2T5EPQ6_VIBSP|nr:acyltransferase [Vibrio splendidus]PTP23801.1 hypothetical protein CWO07_22665 [Vibrio splendidus]
MTDRNLTLDVLKLVLALMVVALHAGFLSEASPLGNFITVQGLFRIAVPLFFVINGYYFLSVNNIKSLTNWLKRTLSLYAFWMIFYVYFWLRPDEFSLIELVKTIKTLIVGYHHLWYLSGMIGAGLLTYLFKNSKSLGFHLSIICLLTGVAIQYVGNYHLLSLPILDKLANMNFIHRNFLFLAFPFFFLGYLLNNSKYKNIITTKMLVIGITIGITLVILESALNFRNPKNDGGYDNYLSLYLVCPLIFLLANNSTKTTKNKTLALMSSAIYFIHPLILSILRKFTELQGTGLTVLCILLSILSSFLIISIHKNKRFRFIL